jgi:catechol 2,3-dioxygenase-like lactoylglutathione lyase family enzyme
MTRPALAGIHHVKIPVTDLPTSVAWYERVFGFRATIEFPDDDGVVRGVGGVIPGFGAATVAFRENKQAAQGCVGFDPFGLGVADRRDLDEWVAHLDALGIEHSPVIEATIGWLLVFHDPDGLEVHLYTWARHGLDHSDRPGYGRPVVDSAPAES